MPRPAGRPPASAVGRHQAEPAGGIVPGLPGDPLSPAPADPWPPSGLQLARLRELLQRSALRPRLPVQGPVPAVRGRQRPAHRPATGRGPAPAAAHRAGGGRDRAPVGGRGRRRPTGLSRASGSRLRDRVHSQALCDVLGRAQRQLIQAPPGLQRHRGGHILGTGTQARPRPPTSSSPTRPSTKPGTRSPAGRAISAPGQCGRSRRSPARPASPSSRSRARAEPPGRLTCSRSPDRPVARCCAFRSPESWPYPFVVVNG